MQKGLSLVGVMIATLILSGAMTSLVSYQVVMNQIRFDQRYVNMGSLLAAEGVELARGVVTENRYSGSQWDEGLDQGRYRVDYTLDLSDGLQSVNTTTCSVNPDELNDSCRLKRNSSNQIYSHTGTDTEDEAVEIYRFVEVIDGSEDNEKRVVSTVVIRNRRTDKKAVYKAAVILYSTS